ncbi:MAG: chemotaxis protein CheB [Betaproteobacteria bacterium]|nr:chemotaxis protein CheB [Betaproteobacteria bacterium]
MVARRTAKTDSGKVSAKLAAHPLKASRAPGNGFTIVGIGASAGGLEALEVFFRHVPPACGLAFVVVQHLDPNHKGVMAELLQRATAMPVEQIRDRMKVEPDHVYVIPPNRDLSILHGVLHLLEPAAPRGLRLPIDYFFRSLAADQQEHSVGVILSGMGSDGTLGLRAIKEMAGAVFVQAPATAKFDGMPRSVVDAGLADVVAPAEELAGRIVSYLQHVPLLATRSAEELEDKDQSGLEKVVLILRAQTGHDFSFYKKSTIYRRIERRMGLHQLPRIADYVRYLRENPQEAGLLFKELLIGVTSFFRDPGMWEQLRNEVIPGLLAAHPDGGMLRAWVPACSTGEEAYSLAIVFRETLDKLKPGVRYSLQVFATDLDHDAIDKARVGAYPANIAADVSDERLHRFFVQEERGYKLSKEIREMVIFAQQNLVMDPPFTKLDLLSCRNLLIYLDADLQKKLLPLFHYSLTPGGILALGSSETIGAATDLFAALPGKNRLYRRQDNLLRMTPVDFPVSHARSRAEAAASSQSPSSPSAGTAASLQAETEALLLRRYAPAAVLTTDRGDLVYVSGKTGKYLEPAAGKANLNLFAMAREGLAGALNGAFAKAVRERSTLVLKDLALENNGAGHRVNVTIQALTEPAVLRGMVLVVFADVAASPVVKAPGKAARASADQSRIAELAQQLQQAHEELQTTREEMQTSQEELKSANEELQSTNEELQSTNEELTTSKEEMQSMNEELQTVNHELTAKVDELSQAGDDMKNLLNSTDIATLFLDDQLKVRRFTSQTASIIKLIPGDAGRPVTDLATELDYPGLTDDAREVLSSLVFRERQVAARDGRWFTVRIMPYRTQANRIDGVVITFVDITANKALEATLREALATLQNRCNEQDTQLDQARTLEGILRQAQAVLEQRIAHLEEATPRQGGKESPRGRK